MDSPRSPYSESFISGEHYAAYEYQIAKDFVIPLLNKWELDIDHIKILDLGCGGGGLIFALSEGGSICTGIDHNLGLIKIAANNASRNCHQIKIIEGDILKLEGFEDKFDLIILSEVLEHLINLENVEKLFNWCKKQLLPNGRIYVSFPPWLNPYGGHQAGWRSIRYIPWFHLYPDVIKRFLVPSYAQSYINFTRELNRLTITSFERLLNETRINIIKKELYHLRPEFKFRYGVPIIRAISFLEQIPIVRELSITGAFYLLGI